MLDLSEPTAVPTAGSSRSEVTVHLSHLGVPASDEPVLTVVDPATGVPVVDFPVGSHATVTAAVDAAEAARRSWAQTPAGARGATLARIADRLDERADRLAEAASAEMGRPVGMSLDGVRAGISTIRQYSELGPVHRGRSLNGNWDATDLMVLEPHGVVAVITPWNDPVAVPAGLLAAALVMGNTVVFKPSERSPWSAALLAEVFAEELPDGVFTCVFGAGETGAALVADSRVRAVAHVGSTRAGRAIAAATAQTGAHCIVENGGSDALIVDSGVDAGWAADQVVLGGFINAGQLCTGVERVVVLRDVADAFLNALEQRARAVTVGAQHDEGAFMGPLVDRRHRDEVHAQVREAVEAGARVVCGGEVPEGDGSFYPPTVLADVRPDMRIWREENFGPVAPVLVVDSFDEALDVAADSPYGLAATVLTPDLAHAQQAWRDLPVGTVKINAVFGGAPGGAAHPRGASGRGFGYGPELLDELSRTKVVHLEPLPSRS